MIVETTRVLRTPLTTLIKTYNGPILGDAYFLRARSIFMKNLSEFDSNRIYKAFDIPRYINPSEVDTEERYAGFVSAFNDFLHVYDGFRNNPVVKSGQLSHTLGGAIDRLIPAGNLSEDTCCSNIHFDILEMVVMYGELYRYVTGRDHPAIDAVLAKEYERELTMTQIRAEPSHRIHWRDYKELCAVTLWKNIGNITGYIMARAITQTIANEWWYMRFGFGVACMSHHNPMSRRVRITTESLIRGASVSINGTEVLLDDLTKERFRELVPNFPPTFGIVAGREAKEFRVDLVGPKAWNYKVTAESDGDVEFSDLVVGPFRGAYSYA